MQQKTADKRYEKNNFAFGSNKVRPDLELDVDLKQHRKNDLKKKSEERREDISVVKTDTALKKKERIKEAEEIGIKKNEIAELKRQQHQQLKAEQDILEKEKELDLELKKMILGSKDAF